MSDVTFGVKVSEEMKNELSELMKSTDLSGKEFMRMLLSSYQLEQNKKDEGLFIEDIKELQKHLGRIQSIYLGMSERTGFIIEETVKEQQQLVLQKEEIITSLQEKLRLTLEKVESKEDKIKELYDVLDENKKKEEELVQELADIKLQQKNNQILHEKYEDVIEGLKEEIENYKRLGVEIEERNEENNKLQLRNDELASEIWFLQREIEKLKETQESAELKARTEYEQLKEKYELELKNSLLEQKLVFSSKIELLKEENFRIEQAYNQKIQHYLEENLRKNSKLE